MAIGGGGRQRGVNITHSEHLYIKVEFSGTGYRGRERPKGGQGT